MVMHVRLFYKIAPAWNVPSVIIQSSGEVVHVIGKGCRLPELFNYPVPVDYENNVDFDIYFRF